MSGEKLQALAAVFDLSVAVLRQPVPSEDEIRKGAEEAQKRYKFIALTKIERALDLQGYMGADAWQVDHMAGLSDAHSTHRDQLVRGIVITASTSS